jgi:hypothetical protein
MYRIVTLSLSVTLNKDHKLRVFKNTVLRKLFGTEKEDVTGWWSKLCNEELHDLYASPNIIRVMKSWRTQWAGHLTYIGRRGMHIEFWWGN